MKLLPLQDVMEADLLFVCEPFYAWCIVDDAHSGFVRIEGYDEHFENCKQQACQLAGDPWHWNDLLLGQKHVDSYVKRGSLALVMEPGDFPLHPVQRAFVENTDGRLEVSTRIWEPEIHERFQYHADRAYHERQERKRYAANHPPTREPEYLPATGPGYRKPTLGPHAEKEGASNDATSTPAQAGYSGAQQTQIEQALKDQRTMLEAKKLELATWDEPAKTNFKKAFGTTDESARKLMQQRIDNMLDANKHMTMDNFMPATEKNPNRFAYVYPTDTSHKIYLDEAFWKTGTIPPDSRAGVLTHEMSHFTDIGDTDDQFVGYNNDESVYGVAESRVLAEKRPDMALKHADSFEYYVENAP